MCWRSLNSILLSLLLAGMAYAQTSRADSLNIRYQIVGSTFDGEVSVLKIKLPPYLTPAEVKEQIRLALAWPGEPLPEVVTKIYVFREDTRRGVTSALGAVFVPKSGIVWKLTGWESKQDNDSYELTPRDRRIYNALLDSMFTRQDFSLESPVLDGRVKRRIAELYGIEPQQVDSIFYRVKWWTDRNGTEGP